MSKTTIEALAEFGQSAWLDNINRNMIESGKLKELIRLGLRGMTSNPAIFDKSIRLSKDYDKRIEELAGLNKSTFEIYDDLTVKDVQDAADLFKKVYDRTYGQDGYVSLEVNPELAFNKKETVKDALRLYKKVDRANVMFKIPATNEGFSAIEDLIAEGLNINATLIFSKDQYVSTANAYIRGLKRFNEKGEDLGKVRSVASVFVSRLDTQTDKIIDERAKDIKKSIIDSLKGKAAVANSRLIYKKYLEMFGSDEFKSLKDKDANVQRVLWASTSTKNPDYSDIKYVTELIGKDTVNTLPDATLDAFLDHGNIEDALSGDIIKEYDAINSLRAIGIDVDNICSILLEDGIKAFRKSFDALLGSIEEKTLKLCKK
ncbi:MAG: transaldolase [Candidatus Omnitrophota bacterium]